jgi:hypothetical protein
LPAKASLEIRRIWSAFGKSKQFEDARGSLSASRSNHGRKDELKPRFDWRLQCPETAQQVLVNPVAGWYSFAKTVNRFDGRARHVGTFKLIRHGTESRG